MRHLVANRFGQRLVERQNIGGGIAEITVSAVNLDIRQCDAYVFVRDIHTLNSSHTVSP